MAVISYFPTANGLNKFSKLGDVIAVRSMSTTSTGTTASYYSNNNLLSTNSYTFSSLKSKITAAYLPYCHTIGYRTFWQASSITIASLPACTLISEQAFVSCTSLLTIIAPNCISISNNAFSACTSLQNIFFPQCVSIGTGTFVLSSPTISRIVNLPKCTFIGQEAFKNNNITDLRIYKVVTIDSNAFANCSITFSSHNVYLSDCITISSSAFINTTIDTTDSLTLNIHFPNCTTIGAYAFLSCYFDGFFWFDNCTTIGSHAFENNYNLGFIFMFKLQLVSMYAFRNTLLNEANFPSCTSIGAGAFGNIAILHSTSFPLCTTITGSITSTDATFYNCTHLTSISLPQITTILTGYVFAGCSRLVSIYLMNSTVCNLTTTSAFRYTPITDSTYTGTFGSIYVPSSLLASYKAATNWKTISARIMGI